MNVKALKKMLENVDDEALVVVNSSDHSYRKANAEATTAFADRWCIYEDHGDKHKCNPGDKRIKVLLIN